MDPKMTQHRAPEAPKTLFEPACRWKLVSEPFWALFGIPRDPENHALAVARCYFLLICVTRPGARNRHLNGPKIEPKTIPRGPRMPKPVAPNQCSNFDQIPTPILTILELQNDTQNRSKTGLRAQGPPRARPGPAQRPPERLREAFWAHFGLNLGPPGAHVRAFSGCTFAAVGLLLVYCWCSFSLASSPPLLAF